MDFITPEQARRDIIALGLPQIVLDAFDEKPLPYNLDLGFQLPAIFSLGPEGHNEYGEGRITPIWQRSSSPTIVAYHHASARRGFFRFDIESQGEEEPIGLTWQQVLVNEFKFLWELDYEWTDDRLREVAGWFHFKHIDLLIFELSQAKRDTFEQDEVWYRSFLEKVRD